MQLQHQSSGKHKRTGEKRRKQPQKKCSWCGGHKGEINWLNSALPNGAWVCNFCFLGNEFDRRMQAGMIKTTNRND